MSCLYRYDMINYFSGPRNVHIFYEFLLKRAGLHTVAYINYLKVFDA